MITGYKTHYNLGNKRGTKMKIILSDDNKKFLEDNIFKIDYQHSYSDDEYLESLDALYFQEVSFVDIDDKKSNQFAKIADIVAEQGEA